MFHAKATQKEMAKTVKGHPREKIDCLSPSVFEGLFFILR